MVLKITKFVNIHINPNYMNYKQTVEHAVKNSLPNLPKVVVLTLGKLGLKGFGVGINLLLLW